MNCLVTGGDGFIGSHLCEALLSQGHDVLCLDNDLTGRRSNTAHLLENNRFQYINADVVTVDTAQFHPHYIFHFASPASPRWYQKYPVETLLANTQGTYRMCELAKREKSVLVFASTSEVYGDPREHPQKESYWGNVNPNGPRSCYDEAKRCGEAFVMTYVRDRGIDGRIIRIFNTYGPRMDKDDGRVVSNFISQLLSGNEITIHGDGTQTRSFCYISDLVEGIVKAAFQSSLSGEVINLGNDHEITVHTLAEKIAAIIGKKPIYNYIPLPTDDPARRKPSLDKAKNLLGWEGVISLEEGLNKTIDYFKTQEI